MLLPTRVWESSALWRTLTREWPPAPSVFTGARPTHRAGSGNWGVDLQAGSQYGYKLLFVVLLSGIFAVFLQVRFIALRCARAPG